MSLAHPALTPSRGEETDAAAPPAPLTEPLIVPVLHVCGLTPVVDTNGTLHVVAWVHTAGEAPERRIVIRFTTANATARAFSEDLRRALTKGGH